MAGIAGFAPARQVLAPQRLDNIALQPAVGALASDDVERVFAMCCDGLLCRFAPKGIVLAFAGASASAAGQAYPP
jgi:hypothetical protein